MRVAIPHDLGREEARRRLQSRGHEVADAVPGGLANVRTSWPTENRMSITVEAMGHELTGLVEIEESQVVFEIELPGMLGFVEPAIAGAIKQQGQKLLEGPK